MQSLQKVLSEKKNEIELILRPKRFTIFFFKISHTHINTSLFSFCQINKLNSFCFKNRKQFLNFRKTLQSKDKTMFSSKNFTEKPIHLVSINSFGKLVLHYEAISFLKSLKSPLSILSIAGPYRTGKSFLLNSLIASTQSLSHANQNTPIFQVGHTTNETTHGLWIWSKPLLAQDQNNQITNVIVMDSQGYASTESTHDKRLITLAILLSTCFLYNSKGSIDKDSLFDLEFVVQVARLINLKKDLKSSQENEKGKCDFHWILRDFHLELINQLGHKITPNQYMQNCFLQAQQKVSQKTIETLKSYFPQRNCHTLCHPSIEQDKQQRPQFISQILGLKQSILKRNMKSLNMSGESFVALLQSYIDAMNEGEEMESVFQEGYDCRVRLDCLQKLGIRLKKLQKEKDDEKEVDKRLLSIKSQIKEYYKERMCSHKQIEVLESEVEEIISGYQVDRNSNSNSSSSKVWVTSLKCMEREKDKEKEKYKEGSRNILSIPKTTGRMARISILCSDNEDRSFVIDEESSQNTGRGSRVVERKSVQKQKMSAQVKVLSVKVEELQVKLHRTQLQLSNAESQGTQLRSQNESMFHNLSHKEDQLISYMQRSSQKEKRLNQSVQILQEQIKDKQQENKILDSEVKKITLLYEEKIQFMQRQLQDQDEERVQEFIIQKNKYKLKVKELTEQIQDMKRKHYQETQLLRDIFIQNGNKTNSLFSIQNDSIQGKNIYEELGQKLKENQKLNQQIENINRYQQKLLEELQTTKFKLTQKEEHSKEELQQINKRHQENQQHIKSIYESKLTSKDTQIQQLQAKIRNLNQIVLKENQKLIASLQQMQSSHSQEKEDLFTMNNQLRNGCVEALQRISALKEELQLKTNWVTELQAQKKQLHKRLIQLRDQSERQMKKMGQKLRQMQRQVNQKNKQTYQQQQTIKSQLYQQVKSQQMQIFQLTKHSQQLSLQIELQRHNNNELQQKVQQLTQKLQLIQSQYHSLQEELAQKEQQITLNMEERENQQFQVKREMIQIKTLLQQTIEELQETNKEKKQLIERQKLVNKLSEQKYQHLEKSYNQKQYVQTIKYEDNLRAVKQNEKKLSSIIEERNREITKLEQRVRILQRQGDQLMKRKKEESKQFMQLREQLEEKSIQYQQLQRKSSKQTALLNQKLSFTQHQLHLLNQQQRSRQTEHQSKQTELTHKIKTLEQSLKPLKQQVIQLEQQLASSKQQLILQQQQLQTAQEQKQFLKHQIINTNNSKDNQIQIINLLNTQKTQHLTQQISNLTQQLQKTNNKLSLHQKDNQILAQNLLQLQEHLRQHQIRSQNHIRLYNDKLTKLKQQKSQLQTLIENKNNTHLQQKKELQQLHINYQNDFNLWTLKLNQMENLLKQAGWIENKNMHSHHNHNHDISKKNPINV